MGKGAVSLTLTAERWGEGEGLHDLGKVLGAHGVSLKGEDAEGNYRKKLVAMGKGAVLFTLTAEMCGEGE